MIRIADTIDSVSAFIGRGVAWLALVIVLLQFALVVARYLFGIGSIWVADTGNSRVIRLDEGGTFHAFGSLGSAYKLTPLTIGVWAAVLRACPASRMLVRNRALVKC